MSAPYALALLAVDGVGRVTAHRVMERFPTPEALWGTPHEQVLLRLKGTPNAEAVVEALMSRETLGPLLDRARAEVDALAAKRVVVLGPGDVDWPAGLDRLPRASRPAAIYAYGRLDALRRPALAVLARAPIAAEPFEQIQDLARRLGARGLGLVTGAAHGVDLALQKVATGAGVPPVAVVGAGLARLVPSFRPAATALVRAGGLLLSPFPMGHGPFDHDDRERALVQAALGGAVCAVASPAGSPEDRAAAWAAEAGRPITLVPPAPPGAVWARDALVVPEVGADAVAALVG